MKQHYYAYKSFIRNKASYSLLPIGEDAVFVDGMYYPEQKFLLLLTKAVKERFQMVPKINEYGEAVTQNGNKSREKQDRIRMDANYEHYLHNPKDIKWFAEEFIVNSAEFLEFVDSLNTKPEVSVPEMVGTIKEEELIDIQNQII